MASRRLGSRIARLGRRAGGPGLVIAGRWTSARPGVVVRIAITAVVGIGLITQLQVMASVQTDEAVAARATQARIG